MPKIPEERYKALMSSVDRMIRAHPGENEKYSPFMAQHEGRLGEIIPLLDVKPPPTVEEFNRYLGELDATLPPVGEM